MLSERTKRRRRRFWIGLVLFVVSCVLLAIWGILSGPTRAGAIFAGLASWIAFVAALTGTWVFADRLRRPDLEIRIGHDVTGQPVRFVDSELRLPRRAAAVRMFIVNHGDAPLTNALINVVVLEGCGLEPKSTDPSRPSRLRQAGGIHQNGEISPNAVVKVRFLVGEHEVFVPEHWIIYAFAVTLPTANEPHPLLVRIDGLGGPPAVHRFELVAESD